MLEGKLGGKEEVCRKRKVSEIECELSVREGKGGRWICKMSEQGE